MVVGGRGDSGTVKVPCDFYVDVENWKDEDLWGGC